MNGIEIVVGGFLVGIFFMACCYFINGLYRIFKKIFNKEKIL